MQCYSISEKCWKFIASKMLKIKSRHLTWVTLLIFVYCTNQLLSIEIISVLSWEIRFRTFFYEPKTSPQPKCPTLSRSRTSFAQVLLLLAYCSVHHIKYISDFVHNKKITTHSFQQQENCSWGLCYRRWPTTTTTQENDLKYLSNSKIRAVWFENELYINEYLKVHR